MSGNCVKLVVLHDAFATSLAKVRTLAHVSSRHYLWALTSIGTDCVVAFFTILAAFMVNEAFIDICRYSKPKRDH